MPSFVLWGKIVELILFFLILLLSSFCQSCIAIFLRMIKIYCKINNIIRTNYSFKRCSDFYDSEKDSFILVRSLFVIDYIFLFFISKSLFDTFQTNIRTRQFFNFSIFDCSITNDHGMEEEINRQPEYCQIDCFVEISLNWIKDR